MTLQHGGIKGLAVAAAAEVTGSSAGSDGILIAIIAGVFGVLTVFLQQYFSDRRAKRQLDHAAESQAEQTNLSNHLVDELVDARAEISRLKDQNRQLRHDDA